MSLRKFVTNPYMEEIYNSFIGDDSDNDYYKKLEETIKQELGINCFEVKKMECGVGLSINAKVNNENYIQIKIIKGLNSLEHQTECCKIQKYLVLNNYPCTKPIGYPMSFLGNSLQIEEYNSFGDYKDSHDENIRQLQVEQLVKLHELLREYKSNNVNSISSKIIPKDRIWQNPPQSVFSFDKQKSGDELIMNKAQSAKSIFEKNHSQKMILSHEDWSNKHFRFTNGRVSVIYDWDSITRIDELYSLGLACSTYTATWYFPTKIFPSPQESKRFVEDYESISGIKYSKEEKEIISAYAAYTLAYIARCSFSQNKGSIKGTDIEIPFNNISNGLYF